jgi:glutamate--cysteine ligase
LNDNILQQESEYYSSIRLKQNIKKGETQLEALEKRGVKHLEIRILDLNPFEKLGLSIEEMYFLHVFILFCLFLPSDPITANEYEKINSNHHHVALFGRKDDLILQKYNNKALGLKEWGKEIFERLKSIAEIINQCTGEEKYLKSVEFENQKLFDRSMLPSEMIYNEMQEKNESFIEFGTKYAINNLQNNNQEGSNGN